MKGFRGRSRVLLAGLGAAALAGSVAASSAGAATISVDTTDDAFNTLGSCSLREAVESANNDAAVGGCTAGSGNDEIVIPGGLYRLTIPRTTEQASAFDNTQGDLDVEDFATLRPRFPLDRVIVDGNGAVTDDRVMQTNAAGGVTLIGLTLRGGAADTFGGGIRNQTGGVLTLNRVTVAGNSSTSGGGGVYVTGATSTATLVNSTVSGNSANGSGGGIRPNLATVTLRNTTVAGNTADADNSGSGDGGGLALGGTATTTLQNALIAGNADTGGEAPDCFVAGGSLTSAGNTLIGTLIGCDGYAAGAGDISGVAPRLGPLAFNGGPNNTRALRPGFAAINGGNNCEPVDQRGLPRALGVGPRCDIGAYELARCFGAIVNRVGTPGANRLVGTNRRDGIMGLAGNDRLLGRGGNDNLCGQNGRDRLLGQRGRDRLYGGRGPDRLFGGAGLDRLFGGPGRDRLIGGPGRDRCIGGPGRDRAKRCAVRRRI
jgi:CSLREA domain-containing protein